MIADALISYKALEVLGTIICVIVASAMVCMMMPASNRIEDEDNHNE